MCSGFVSCWSEKNQTNRDLCFIISSTMVICSMIKYLIVSIECIEQVVILVLFCRVEVALWELQHCSLFQFISPSAAKQAGAWGALCKVLGSCPGGHCVFVVAVVPILWRYWWWEWNSNCTLWHWRICICDMYLNLRFSWEKRQQVCSAKKRFFSLYLSLGWLWRISACAQCVSQVGLKAHDYGLRYCRLFFQ